MHRPSKWTDSNVCFSRLTAAITRFGSAVPTKGLRGYCPLAKTARYRSKFHALRRLPIALRQQRQSLLRSLKANTPMEAAELSKVLDSYTRAVEAADLAARLARLQQAQKK
jgi:hypothetical protein